MIRKRICQHVSFDNVVPGRVTHYCLKFPDSRKQIDCVGMHNFELSSLDLDAYCGLTSRLNYLFAAELHLYCSVVLGELISLMTLPSWSMPLLLLLTILYGTPPLPKTAFVQFLVITRKLILSPPFILTKPTANTPDLTEFLSCVRPGCYHNVFKKLSFAVPRKLWSSTSHRATRVFSGMCA